MKIPFVRGMNIHVNPAILMWTKKGYYWFWHTAISGVRWKMLWWHMFFGGGIKIPHDWEKPGCNILLMISPTINGKVTKTKWDTNKIKQNHLSAGLLAASPWDLPNGISRPHQDKLCTRSFEGVKQKTWGLSQQTWGISWNITSNRGNDWVAATSTKYWSNYWMLKVAISSLGN